MLVFGAMGFRIKRIPGAGELMWPKGKTKSKLYISYTYFRYLARGPRATVYLKSGPLCGPQNFSFCMGHFWPAGHEFHTPALKVRKLLSN